MKKIAFTGGGSAGHVVPNLALIDEIVKDGKTDVCYFGTDGIERDLTEKKKIPYFAFSAPKLVRGKSFTAFKNNCKIPFRFSAAVKKAEEGLKEFAPDLVFSKGGYVALPVVVAARRLKIPVLTHESDFSPGLTTKLVAKKCEYVLTSFPETVEAFKNGKYTGAPIRRELFSFSRSEGRASLDLPKDKKIALVFGGGSGSQVINAAVRKLVQKRTDLFFLHAVGKGNVVHSNLKNYRQTEFIKDMGAAYAAADVVISRAGAGSVFEILALKKPAILIPLEGQTRGDQKENAAYFEKKGLCHVLKQSELDGLEAAIDQTLDDEKLRDHLSTTLFKAGNENILREIYALL